MSNIREIQARGAVIIVITEEDDDTVRPYADHLIEIPALKTHLFGPFLSTFRCRCSPPLSRRPAATTSTATQPSQVGHRRMSARESTAKPSADRVMPVVSGVALWS